MSEQRDDPKDKKESGPPHRKSSDRAKGTKTTSGFKGQTPGMHGNVFEVLGEKGYKNQFKDTLEALERYAGETYPREVALLQPLFKRLEHPKVETPAPPMNFPKKVIKEEITKSGDEEEEEEEKETDESTSEWEKLIFRERIKMYLHQEQRLKSTLIGLYNVTWGQCSRKMKDQLEANEGYAKISKADDVVGLLKLIKVLSHQFAVNRSLEESLDDATLKMMAYQQGEDDSVADHIRNIKNLCNMLEHYGGWLIDDEKLIEVAKKKDRDENVAPKSDAAYRKMVRNKSAALRALKSSKHKAVLRDIRKKFLYKKRMSTQPTSPKPRNSSTITCCQTGYPTEKLMQRKRRKRMKKGAT